MRCDNIHFVRPISAPHHALITRDEVTKLPSSAYCGRGEAELREFSSRETRVFVLRIVSAIRSAYGSPRATPFQRSGGLDFFNRIDRNVGTRGTMSLYQIGSSLLEITFESIRIPFLKFNRFYDIDRWTILAEE